MVERIQKIITRHKELETLLATPEVANNRKKMEDMGREYNHLGKMLPQLKEYLSAATRLADAKTLLKTESDHDLIEMAHEEIKEIEQILPDLEKTAKLLLVPKDPVDAKNAMVEIRAGTGGTEAGIFAADLFRMYTQFAEQNGFGIEIMSSSPGERGALKEVIFMINGPDAYGTFKFESGVHRVQRVPETEAQGRVHTSAASVAIFPEADEVELDISPADLRIDVYRSSGPGGQSVNTTDSAVRVVHVPTGIIVTCQDEKSQHKNKAKALKVLRSRLLENQRAEIAAAESASRKTMVSTGDRSAKIRTYNFPQGRVTDHRINLTLYRLEAIINGDIQELINALSIADMNERIKNVE
jgi:peptide chain release factor 1